MGSAQDHVTRIVALLAFILPSILVPMFFEVSGDFVSFLEWCSAHTFVSVPFFIILYILAGVPLLPDVVLAVGAGAVWGVVRGFIFTYAASMVALMIGFALGRLSLRKWAVDWLRHHDVWPSVDIALSEDSEFVDWKVVGLTRLSAIIPFQLQNILLGATAVRTFEYTVASAVGIIPGTLVMVYFGHAGRDLKKLSQGDFGISRSVSAVLKGVGMVALLAAAVLMIIYVQRSLKQRLADERQSRDSNTRTELTRSRSGGRMQHQKSAELTNARSELLANEV